MELVVERTPNILLGILNYSHHPVRSLSLSHLRDKPVLEAFDGWLALETWEVGSKHQRDCINELCHMGSDCEEGLDGQLNEEVKALRAFASHKRNHFVIQLEGVWFEFHALNQAPDISIVVDNINQNTYSGTYIHKAPKLSV